MIICNKIHKDCYFRHELDIGETKSLPICLYAEPFVILPKDCDKYITREEAERKLRTEIAEWKGDK